MIDTSKALEELRIRFRSNSLARLEEVSSLLDKLSANLSDTEALTRLLHHFHGLAGLGATYGYPLVSILAHQAERDVDELLSEKIPSRQLDLNRWRELARSIHEDLVKDAAPLEANPGTPGERSPLDVLIVDRDPEVHLHLTRLLEEEGMTARSTLSLAAASRAIDKRLPDAILCDLELPDGSGYKLIEELRLRPQGMAVVAFILSKQSGFVDKVDAMRCGADGYVEKPIDWPTLIRRLQHLLTRAKVDPVRVLAVEDEPDHAAFVELALKSAGYIVLTLTDPGLFEESIASFNPDLIVLDVNLPHYSGYELARYVRAQEALATIPIIFLTTAKETRDRIQSIASGGDDHLAKPIEPALLVSTIASRVERARFMKTLLERDGLTSLLSHSAFIERLRSAVARSLREPDSTTALVMLDIDHFKRINDTYGHPVGDRVLTSLAAFLRRKLRQTDSIGRYGGEEFALLLEGLTKTEAVRLVTSLLEDYTQSEQYRPKGETLHVTFSAGVAIVDRGTTLESVLGRADGALYAAKAAGRNCVRAAD